MEQILTEGSCWRVAGLLGQLPNQCFARCLPDSLAHAVKDLARGDPVQGGSGPKGGKHIAGCCKHWLVECRQEGPKDDHAGWRDDVSNGAAQTLAGIAQKLGNGLQIANLHQQAALRAISAQWHHFIRL